MNIDASKDSPLHMDWDMASIKLIMNKAIARMKLGDVLSKHHVLRIDLEPVVGLQRCTGISHVVGMTLVDDWGPHYVTFIGIM